MTDPFMSPEEQRESRARHAKERIARLLTRPIGISIPTFSMDEIQPMLPGQADTDDALIYSRALLDRTRHTSRDYAADFIDSLVNSSAPADTETLDHLPEIGELVYVLVSGENGMSRWMAAKIISMRECYRLNPFLWTNAYGKVMGEEADESETYRPHDYVRAYQSAHSGIAGFMIMQFSNGFNKNVRQPITAKGETNG